MILNERKLELYITNEQQMAHDVEKTKSDCVNASNYLNDYLQTLFQCCDSKKSSGYKNLDHLDAKLLKIMINYKHKSKCLIVEAALHGHFEMIQWLVKKGYDIQTQSY